MSVNAKLTIKWTLCNILGALIVIAVALGLASIIKTQSANLAVLIIVVVYFLAGVFAIFKGRPDHDNKTAIWVVVGMLSPIILISALVRPSTWDWE